MANVKSNTPNNPADFTPELGNYRALQPFRYWCQKVLPLVYDDSLSYYELLCKVVDYLNKTMEDVETLNGDVTSLHEAYVKLEEYVNNYFTSLDVQEEINNKLNQMASGELFDIMQPFFTDTQNEINTLKSRINSLEKLPDGSTTGDAELIDGRISWTGSNYDTIGENIRDSDKNINKLLGSVIFPNNIIPNDYIGMTLDDFFKFSEKGAVFSDYIEINNLVPKTYLYKLVGVLKTDNEIVNRQIISRVYYYGDKKQYITWYALGNESYEPIVNESKYVRFYINSNELINLYPGTRITQLSVGCNLTTYQPQILTAQYSKILNRVLSENNFKIINRLGYRGYGGTENSLYAYKQAVLLGYKYILCDLNFTKDGIPVCLHDTTINRIARNLDGSTIEKTIYINDITYEETEKYDFGIKGNVSQIGVTKFVDVLKIIKYSNAKLYIEYKGGEFHDYDNVIKIIKSYGMYNNFVITSGFNLLSYLTNKYENLETGLITPDLGKNIEEFNKINAKRKFYFGNHDETLSEALREKMYEYNIEFECGTVNTVGGLLILLNSETGNMCVGVESDLIFGSDVVSNYTVDNKLTTVTP